MLRIDTRNPPNEMPDIVGYKPENPLAANFKPYISARTRMRELTPVPLIIGTFLGIIFGASSLYLVLKVGLTVSAAIPVAVISITLFLLFSKFGSRDATILENNVVKTAGQNENHSMSSTRYQSPSRKRGFPRSRAISLTSTQVNGERNSSPPEKRHNRHVTGL